MTNILKPIFWKVVLFLFVKTIVFAVMIAFVNDRYISWVTDPYKEPSILKNTIDYFNYILIFAVIPSIIMFSIPMYLSFSIRRPLFFVVSILFIFILDYLFYAKMGGFVNNLERFYFWISNFFCFLLFFYRKIKTKLFDAGK
jgi:hypothetical protein